MIDSPSSLTNLRNKAWMRHASFAVRVLISATLVYYLLSRVDLPTSVRQFFSARRPFIALACVFWALAIFVSTVRWQGLLRALRIQVPLHVLLALNMIALFYSQILPGYVSGDILKSIRMVRQRGSTKETLVAVTADRLSGFFGLLLLGWVGLAAAPEWRDELGLAAWIPLGLGSLIVLLLLVVIGGLAALPHLSSILLPGYVADLRDKLVEVLGSYRQYPASLVIAIAWSLLFHTLASVIIYVLSLAIGAPIPFFSVPWIYAVVSILQFLPISIGALGVRENAMVILLGLYGVPASDALAISVGMLALAILAALLGGILELLGNTLGWQWMAHDDAPPA